MNARGLNLPPRLVALVPGDGGKNGDKYAEDPADQDPRSPRVRSVAALLGLPPGLLLRPSLFLGSRPILFLGSRPILFLGSRPILFLGLPPDLFLGERGGDLPQFPAGSVL